MILSFRDKRSETFAHGGSVREFRGFERQAWKRLEILDAATSLLDLRALPSNRLEALKGPGGPVQHPRQHAMANLLRMAKGRSRPLER
jgi:plasmid maintenance system killer protein